VDFKFSSRTQDYLTRIRAFMEEHVLPIEESYFRNLTSRNHGSDWTKWRISPAIESLKAEARSAGLWNLFLPDRTLGAGLSTLEYAPLAEETGHSLLAPEVFNCNAPDTGNMEVLWHCGTPDQKEAWLKPLLDGEIRSAFCMTEPDVASSDATNIEATIEEDGDDLVLNGRKWWATGIGHPRCKLAIFMGVSDPAALRHERHSMVLVPMPMEGVTIKRMLTSFGEYDEPYGHGEVWFENARVPKENLILGKGRGLEIAQIRLGPGRIHHCMRAIGAAERALALMITRGITRAAFGKPIINLGGNREVIADLRIAIDQARLLTLFAAWKIDDGGALGAMKEISAIKVVAPNVLQRVVDEAIQMHGGAGVSHDFPLAALFSLARSLRIADGPDAVHRGVIGRLELRKYKSLIDAQKRED
jgi:alkylation response protein AidB-like acyl-CoA dehydrogenase